jgi:hypothetical protein
MGSSDVRMCSTQLSRGLRTRTRRAALSGGGSAAVGVDPGGNAVIGGYSTDDDGGYSYFIVKLGP